MNKNTLKKLQKGTQKFKKAKENNPFMATLEEDIEILEMDSYADIMEDVNQYVSKHYNY